MSSADEHDGRWARPSERVLLVIALTASSFLLWGNAVDELVKFLPAVHRMVDPSLYPGDLEVDACERLLGWGLAPLAVFERLGMLDAGILGCTVLARLLLALAALALARPLARDEGEALGAAALVVLAHPAWGVVGAFRVIGAEPVASHLAIPFGVAALGAALAGRPLAAGVLVGFGANLHPMVSFAVVPALVLAADDARARVRCLLGAGCAAIPVLVWTALHGAPDLGAVDPARGEAIARQTVGVHLFWSFNAGSTRDAFLASLAIMIAAWPSRGAADEVVLRRLRRALVASVGAIAAYVLLAESGAAPLLLLKAHPLRVSLWTSVLARIVVGLAAAREVRRGDPLGVLAAALLVVGCVDASALLAPGAACLALARARRRELWWPLAMAGGSLPVALLVGELDRSLVPALARCLALAGVALGARALAGHVLAPGGRASTLLARPAAGLGIGLALLLGLRTAASSVSLGVELPRLDFRPERLHDPESVALARWAAEQTPVAARFLVHPDLIPFQAYSRRSVVASVAVATLSIWDLRLHDERIRRLRDLGWEFHAGRARHAYQTLPGAQVEALAARYGADHVVIERVPAAARLSWPVVHESRRFVVYRRP